MANYIIGVKVDDEVYVYRQGKKVVVARYKNGKKVWDERQNHESKNRTRNSAA